MVPPADRHQSDQRHTAQFMTLEAVHQRSLILVSVLVLLAQHHMTVKARMNRDVMHTHVANSAFGTTNGDDIIYRWILINHVLRSTRLGKEDVQTSLIVLGHPWIYYSQLQRLSTWFRL